MTPPTLNGCSISTSPDPRSVDISVAAAGLVIMMDVMLKEGVVRKRICKIVVLGK